MSPTSTTKRPPKPKKLVLPPEDVKAAEAAFATPPKFPAPTNLATAADLYYTLMQDRLAKQREADRIEEYERYVKGWIIDNLPMSQASGIAGAICSVRVVPKVRPQVKDWDAFYDFIVKNRKKGAFALLNRAVNAKSVSEYWAAKKAVPGVEAEQYKTLSYSKIGEVPK